MSLLSAFTDFYNVATGPANLTDPKTFINDAQYRNYETFNALSRAKMAVQGGSYIQDAIFFDDPNLAQTVHAMETITFDNVQALDKLTLPWKFLLSKVIFTAQEVELNQKSGDRFQQFKNMMDEVYMKTYLSLANKIETLLTADASLTNMENGRDPNSIFVTLTSDGLAPSGYTTVQNVNPTTQSKWRNATASYTAASFLDPDVGLAAGFDTIYELVNFRAPVPGGFDQANFMESKVKDCVILTNREGMADVRKVMRTSNDFLRAGSQDMAYSAPAYDGVLVKPCAAFDDVNSDVFSAGSPGFLFLNMQTFKLVYHASHWLDKSPLDMRPDQPNVSKGIIQCWFNLWNSSRLRSGWLRAA